AFLDLEMTGLNVEKHEILEIGLVLARHLPDKDGNFGNDMEILAEREWKVKPEHIETADPAALAVNQYQEKNWAEAIDLKQALSELSELTHEAILVGHNVAFDFLFLEKGFLTTDVPNTMHYHKMDTLSLAYAVLYRNPDLLKFSLRELCLHFGIHNIHAHTALSDAKATFELYKKLLPSF
ncbi:MAG TPA: 3'-5' exonuclease, partial [Candidatus Paceibacterota bacterium]|nr:3'-5' exonuclease [Candidatus Paceibacterota bacterium]